LFFPSITLRSKSPLSFFILILKSSIKIIMYSLSLIFHPALLIFMDSSDFFSKMPSDHFKIDQTFQAIFLFKKIFLTWVIHHANFFLDRFA
jgi:hypothetical protein